jgi:RNA polymerase sigma factor (sigma-70 family)
MTSSSDPATTTRAERLADHLERARAGEAGALDAIVRELNPLLWHVARSQGVPASDVSDVVQNTWLELVAHLDGIRSPGALTAWLVVTTKREAWRTNRKRQSMQPSGTGAELADIPDDAPDPSTALITGERDRILWHAFQQLSDRCRALLRIVAMVDRPDYGVVGEALGMPHGSIGPTRGRCLAKLRVLLQADPLWKTS